MIDRQNYAFRCKIMLQKTPLNSSLIFAQKPSIWSNCFRLSAFEMNPKWYYFQERTTDQKCSTDIRNESIVLSLAVWHLLIVGNFYYKNCYCRWQKWDNKTNKYRNAVNRAHKSQFSINFISHFWTKTKQFLAADVFPLLPLLLLFVEI